MCNLAMLQSLNLTRKSTVFITVNILSLTLLCLYYTEWYDMLEIGSFWKSSERSNRGSYKEFWVSFPALRNFKLEDNTGGEFGLFPLSENYIALLNISNFTISKAFLPAMTDKEKLVSLWDLDGYSSDIDDYNYDIAEYIWNLVDYVLSIIDYIYDVVCYRYDIDDYSYIAVDYI
uniref:Uncharacterized protein n=1 Tax=Octopus bimaculoides TaxID=37653 RepID=A0A0L8G7W7_OCTBM